MIKIRSKVLQTIQKIIDRTPILDNETEDVAQFRAFVVEKTEEDERHREISLLMCKQDQMLLDLSRQYPEEWIAFISTNNRDLVRVLAHHHDNEEMGKMMTEFVDEDGQPKIPLQPDECISETFGYHHRLSKKDPRNSQKQSDKSIDEGENKNAK